MSDRTDQRRSRIVLAWRSDPRKKHPRSQSWKFKHRLIRREQIRDVTDVRRDAEPGIGRHVADTGQWKRGCRLRIDHGRPCLDSGDHLHVGRGRCPRKPDAQLQTFVTAAALRKNVSGMVRHDSFGLPCLQVRGCRRSPPNLTWRADGSEHITSLQVFRTRGRCRTAGRHPGSASVCPVPGRPRTSTSPPRERRSGS
jgi:hypothetical protein